jgi:hypothetical protein
MTHEEKTRMNQLEATLREIIEIDTTAATDPYKDGSMSYDLALDGKLLRRWQHVKQRAATLLSP